MSASDFRFEPLCERDLAMLLEWRRRPHVAQWWPEAAAIDELRADYLAARDPNAVRAYIASVASRPVGFIQCYAVMGSGDGWWESETDPGARGIDQFLAEPDQLGKGFGRAMIRSFARLMFDDPGVSVIQTDPNPVNERAIRCYLASGFTIVGTVDTPDGAAVLMRCTRQTLAQAERALS